MTTENGQKVGLAGTTLWHTHTQIYIYIYTYVYIYIIYAYTHTQRMRTIALSIVVILGTYHRMFTSAYMIINDHIHNMKSLSVIQPMAARQTWGSILGAVTGHWKALNGSREIPLVLSGKTSKTTNI